jgi:hypothetical protein
MRGQRHPITILVALLVGLGLHVRAGQQATEWRLEVSAESAAIHLKPDANSPVVASVPRGTILKSYAKEGDWFRVIPGPGQEGILTIGYISSPDVAVLEEKVQGESDYWLPQTAKYRGLGLVVKVGGGVNTIARGELDRGARGIFDSGVSDLMTRGFDLFDKGARPLRSGYNLNGDIIYMITSRFGIGLGFDYLRNSGDDFQQFGHNEYQISTLFSRPIVHTYSIRLGPHYELPLSGILMLRISGGPALVLAHYWYSYGASSQEFEDLIAQNADARALGLWGGLGFEIAMNNRVGFFVEAQGRYARITDFKGSERYDQTKNFVASVTKMSGYLYLVEDGPFPRLAVVSDSTAAGQNARRAVFNFTGVNLVGGLKVRF